MNLLFDLDGTLTDPFDGITNSIKFALKKVNHSIPEDLSWCIGPPLKSSFERILDGTGHCADKAVSDYREYFGSKGMLENKVYENIDATLRALKDEGYQLFVATSKPHVYARQILNHFKLDGYFKEIYGSELNGLRADKSELIAFILEKESLDPQKTFMIGDRKFDLAGAHKNGVQSVAVSWGYGNSYELMDESPLAIVNTPNELAMWFLDKSENANESRVSIVPLETADPEWAFLRCLLWPDQSPESHQQELEQLAGETYCGWKIMGSDQVAIGFAEASIRPFANGCKSQPVGFLEGIWVHPDFRRQGVGRILCEQVEEWIKSKGVDEMGSDSLISNGDSIASHHSWGFEETERVVYFSKKLKKD